MKNNVASLLALLLFHVTQINAQVPVSQEPYHHLVFQNKYIRMIDAWIQPHDTSQFHIHSTPSLFVYLSNTNMGLQIQGKDWTAERSIAGKAWYRSFSPDSLIHRVANLDSVPLHVNDIEILSSYDASDLSRDKLLPFSVLFENEKAIAYQATAKSLNQNEMKTYGPLIVVTVQGNEIVLHDLKTGQSKEIRAGQYLYIDPGTSFYFTAKKTSEINLVLFEIK